MKFKLEIETCKENDIDLIEILSRISQALEKLHVDIRSENAEPPRPVAPVVAPEYKPKSPTEE